MPFPATWMKPEFHSEQRIVSQFHREKPYDIPYMRNLKRNDANKLIYKTESQIQRMNLWFPEGKRQGVWDGHVHTAISKMDNQQAPAIQHRELCSILHGRLDGRGVWEKMDTGICMAESLCCPPETLLIGYNPI